MTSTQVVFAGTECFTNSSGKEFKKNVPTVVFIDKVHVRKRTSIKFYD